LLKPDLLPDNIETISQNIKGAFVSDMHNYWIKSTGRYYFSGMYTAVLPMIPGIYAVYTMIKVSRLPKKYLDK
jgi:uncharacterized membrane protein YjjB (DUF3815 family)